MKGQLFSGMWLPLSWEVKGYMANDFNIPRNGATHVDNNRVVSDGFLDQDLAKINVDSLQMKLDSKETDFFKLWDEYKTKVIEITALKPVERSPEKKTIEVKINIEGDKVTVSEEKVVEVTEQPKRTYVKKIKQDTTPAA